MGFSPGIREVRGGGCDIKCSPGPQTRVLRWFSLWLQGNVVVKTTLIETKLWPKMYFYCIYLDLKKIYSDMNLLRFLFSSCSHEKLINDPKTSSRVGMGRYEILKNITVVSRYFLQIQLKMVLIFW